MKYNILINQQKMAQDERLTLSDCAILDYLSVICGTTSEKVSQKRLDGFTWVNLSHLMDQMPLLKIKSVSGASRAIARVRNYGYIETLNDKKNNKLYIKPKQKMMDIFFGKGVAYEQEGVASKQDLVGERCCVQATNNTTIYNTTKDNISDVVSEQEEKGPTLPLSRGKTPLQRVISIYCTLYSNKYDLLPRSSFSVLNKVFKEILKTHTEVEIAYYLTIYFSWAGMDGKDKKEGDFFTKNTNSVFLFKSNLDKFMVHAKNVLGVDIENREKLLELVGEYIRSL